MRPRERLSVLLWDDLGDGEDLEPEEESRRAARIAGAAGARPRARGAIGERRGPGPSNAAGKGRTSAGARPTGGSGRRGAALMQNVRTALTDRQWERVHEG